MGFGEGDARDVWVCVGGCEEVLAGLVEVDFELFFGGAEGGDFGGLGGLFFEGGGEGGFEVGFLEVQGLVGAVFGFVAGLEGGEGGFEVGDVGLVGGLC